MRNAAKGANRACERPALRRTADWRRQAALVRPRISPECRILGVGMRLPRPNNYLVANLVLWALTYLIVTARVMADPMPHAGAMALRRLGMAAFGFAACLVIGRVLAALAEQPIWRRLVAAVLL